MFGHSGQVSRISDFMDFRSEFRVFRSESKNFTSDIKNFRDFKPDLIDCRDLRSDFKDYRNFRENRNFREYSGCRDFRPYLREFKSGFRTSVHPILEEFAPQSRALNFPLIGLSTLLCFTSMP